MASKSTLILSHPLSSGFPPNRTTLSFHTRPRPASILTLSPLRPPKSKLFPSSSLTGSTWTVTALSPSKLVPSSSLTGSTRTVTALSPSKLVPSSSLTGSTRTVTALSPSKIVPSSSLTGSTRTVTVLSPFKLVPSSSLTGSTRTVTTLSPSKLVHSSSLTGLTRTVTALFPSILVASKICPLSFLKPSNTLSTAAVPGPLFSAPISNVSAPGTQIAVIVVGLARRCIEIYSRVLLIRFLLSLYPNMEWDEQPMSAIKDLCDPFLGLFRGVIPPLFNSLDVTPMLAFLLLGILGQFAKSPGLF